MKKVMMAFIMFLGICTVINAQHKVGDIYNKDGIKGFVIQVTSNGAHGLIMSLQASPKKWLADKEAKFDTGAFYEDDGMKNMEALNKYIQANGKSWSDFPLFEWAKSLGEGWYIPSKDELQIIAKAINGDAETYSDKYISKIDKIIKKAKGDGLIQKTLGQKGTMKTMFSSTEAEGGLVYLMDFQANATSALLGNGKKGKIKIIPQYKNISGKFIGFGSRAICKF